jgi:hypothetical protein
MLAREFSLLWLEKPILREIAKKEYLLSCRVVVKKSTA